MNQQADLLLLYCHASDESANCSELHYHHGWRDAKEGALTLKLPHGFLDLAVELGEAVDGFDHGHSLWLLSSLIAWPIASATPSSDLRL